MKYLNNFAEGKNKREEHAGKQRKFNTELDCKRIQVRT